MQVVDKFNVQDGNLEETTIYGLAYTSSLIIKKIEEYLKPYNLNTTNFNCLMVIKHQGKKTGISQIDISQNLIVTTSNVARILEKLENEKLIERCAQKEDRRVNLVTITKKGSDLLDEIWDGYKSAITGITELLPKDELKKLNELLTKWHTKLEIN